LLLLNIKIQNRVFFLARAFFHGLAYAQLSRFAPRRRLGRFEARYTYLKVDHGLDFHTLISYASH
jgi:hypothetical protein